MSMKSRGWQEEQRHNQASLLLTEQTNNPDSISDHSLWDQECLSNCSSCSSRLLFLLKLTMSLNKGTSLTPAKRAAQEQPYLGAEEEEALLGPRGAHLHSHAHMQISSHKRWKQTACHRSREAPFIRYCRKAHEKWYVPHTMLHSSRCASCPCDGRKHSCPSLHAHTHTRTHTRIHKHTYTSTHKQPQEITPKARQHAARHSTHIGQPLLLLIVCGQPALIVIPCPLKRAQSILKAHHKHSVELQALRQ